MKRLLFPIILLGLLILSACDDVEPEASASTTATLHEMTVTATAEGWEAPESVPAGWTRITLNNQSDGLRQAAFMRLADGKTMDDVFAAIDAGMEEPAPWMAPFGGVSAVLPGESGAVSVNLTSGQYIVIDPVPAADGVPGMAKGYFMPLTVEENDLATAAPAADLEVNMVDYAFHFDDTFSAGSHTIKVTNNGPQEAHEMVIVKLDEGATVDGFLAAFAPDAPGGPLPGRFVAGTAAFAESSGNYLEVTLEEGATYGVICFTPSPAKQGQPHFMLGMVAQVKVP